MNRLRGPDSWAGAFLALPGGAALGLEVAVGISLTIALDNRQPHSPSGSAVALIFTLLGPVVCGLRYVSLRGANLSLRARLRRTSVWAIGMGLVSMIGLISVAGAVYAF